MKRQVIVEIEPHEDGVRCGECRGVTTDEDNEYCAWAEPNWDESHKGPFLKNLGDTRGPECLAAEKRLRDLVEAGNELEYSRRDLNDGHDGMTRAWDRALAAIKGDA